MYGREIMLIQGTIPFNISISGLHGGIHTWSGSAESTRQEQMIHEAVVLTIRGTLTGWRKEREPDGVQQQKMQIPAPGNTYTGFLVHLAKCKWYMEVSERCGVL